MTEGCMAQDGESREGRIVKKTPGVILYGSNRPHVMADIQFDDGSSDRRVVEDSIIGKDGAREWRL